MLLFFWPTLYISILGDTLAHANFILMLNDVIDSWWSHLSLLQVSLGQDMTIKPQLALVRIRRLGH